MLENKLGIANEVELAREEERLTKLRARELFEMGLFDSFEVGTSRGFVPFIVIFSRMCTISPVVCVRSTLPRVISVSHR